MTDLCPHGMHCTREAGHAGKHFYAEHQGAALAVPCAECGEPVGCHLLTCSRFIRGKHHGVSDRLIADPPADDLCARLLQQIGPDRLDAEDQEAYVPRWLIEEAAARIAAQDADITRLRHENYYLRPDSAKAVKAAEARCAELERALRGMLELYKMLPKQFKPPAVTQQEEQAQAALDAAIASAEKKTPAD